MVTPPGDSKGIRPEWNCAPKLVAALGTAAQISLHKGNSHEE